MPKADVVVTALIVDRPTCVPCIARKTDLTVAGVNRVLAKIAESIRIHRLPKARCQRCGESVATVSIDPPA